MRRDGKVRCVMNALRIQLVSTEDVRDPINASAILDGVALTAIKVRIYPTITGMCVISTR